MEVSLAPGWGLRKEYRVLYMYTRLSEGWGGENRDTAHYLRSCKVTLQSLSQPGGNDPAQRLLSWD